MSHDFVCFRRPKRQRQLPKAQLPKAQPSKAMINDYEQHTFTTFLQLEDAARRAETVEALRYSMVNELRRLIDYRLAALVIGSAATGGIRVEAVSGVAVLELDTPLLRWLTRAVRQVAKREDAARVQVVPVLAVAARERAEWAEWCPVQVLWCPLVSRDGQSLGALWLARDRPWTESEAAMVERLAACYAHAWLALTGGRPPRVVAPRTRRLALAAAVVVAVAGLSWPVRQSALAPAEVVAAMPITVAAPIDGVIARFFIEPNQTVTAGQPLFAFDDTTLKSQAAVAERTLGIAQAELRQASQGAMIDRKQAGQVALLEAQTQLRATELEYSRSLLARITVIAERPGVAVFADANDWIGRPVATGQRIFFIADPAPGEARVPLAVRDANALTSRPQVELFLDPHPMRPLPATQA
ncbi:HlyD family efflux transporter periplasmic adaptor subunit [uncultured Gammaproteobacteria bacterium]